MNWVRLREIKIVKEKLASGEIKVYHYAYRGGPVIWRSDFDYKLGFIEYLRAYWKAHDEAGHTSPEPEPRSPGRIHVRRKARR